MATPVKTRILAGGVHSVKQQIVRIDRQGSGASKAAVIRDVSARAKRAARRADAIIASDYGSGLVTARGIAAIRPRGAQLFVDSRYRLLDFHGMTACTPNESEVEALVGAGIGEDARALEKAGRTLLRKTGAEAMLVTRGSRGMALFEPKQPTVRIPIFGSDEVAVRRGRAAGQLRRRPCRHEARHRHRLGRRAARRGARLIVNCRLSRPA
jgi:bifunctional ADP-heptose synthase (sugar kinase/adenylyltransferase)